MQKAVRLSDSPGPSPEQRATAHAYVVLAATLFGLGFLGARPPEQLDQMPKLCLASHLLGRPCPACGTLHALSALLHGDLAAAWAFNPNVVVVAPVLLWIVVAQVIVIRRAWRSARSQT